MLCIVWKVRLMTGDNNYDKVYQTNSWVDVAYLMLGGNLLVKLK